ncbi:MAG TPA: hypothetical protein VFR41_06040 [Acidimicrobiia bacterium]|nr:hypothetical protein [Acidimicrobiia bacterium]
MISLWCARGAWLVLPVTAGAALADAIAPWSTSPQRCAAVMLWLAWAATLFALFAPRPWGLTLVRVAAPLAVVLVLAAVFSTSGGSAVLAVATTILAAVLALSRGFAGATANALAYGDEVRFPLRIPTPLLLGPIPLAIALIGAATLAPVLFADGRYVLGIVFGLLALVAAALVRSLHALSRRWLVVVPAGVTVVDPLTLVEPVLMPRRMVTRIDTAPRAPVQGNVLDLRLGTLQPGIAIDLTEGIVFARRKGRRDAALIEPSALLVTVVSERQFRTLASSRQLPTART